MQHLHSSRSEHSADRSRQRSSRSAPTALEPAVLTMQRAAGNVATAQAIVVSRAPLTPTEKAQNLTSARYAGQPVLEAAVQQGLVDAGFAMPISMRSGSPDGIFGPETAATVRAFQTANGLTPDARVGRHTLGRLDELAGGKASGEPASRSPTWTSPEPKLIL